MLAEGVWAEVVVNGERLRLFSENSPLGFQTSVYNVTTKSWIALLQLVDSTEQGKDRAPTRAAPGTEFERSSEHKPESGDKKQTA